MRIELLDHGYLELVEHWGSDESVIRAARMSTQKGFLGWGESCAECGYAKGEDHEVGCSRPEKWKPGDEKLLRFLYENGHSTPFEMAGLIVEVQAPIFVFREWHRHRTQGYSEMSARYAPLPDFNYVPTVERCMRGGGHLTKQAGTIVGAPALTEEATLKWLRDLAQFYDHAEAMYQNGLANGVPKELARIVLPVGRYSRMRATACLRNWMLFMTLRSAPNAQHEIRVYSDAIGKIVAERFPRTWALFAEGKAT